MKAHTEQEFQTFMSQLTDTNATLSFFTDFDKCAANVDKIALRLNQLNYLVGQPDMEKAIRTLWTENPKAFSVLDILIAVRRRDNKKVLNRDGTIRLVSSYFDNVDDVLEFIKATGLEDVLKDKKINNLVDYVFGIEVGLDTNTRKNRSGDITERHVEDILKTADINYRKEVSCNEFPIVEAALGKDTKRFDFVINTATKTYLIEVNFYSGGGSKLNEVARAYTELAPKINACEGYEFVWITDGVGWNSAKSKLAEAFYAIPSIYNLTTIKEFVNQITA